MVQLLLSGGKAILEATGLWDNIIKLFDPTYEGIDKLKEASEKLANAAAEASKKYKEITDTFEGFNSAKEKLNSLTEGTVQFYQAIADANIEAQKLIESLNLIAGIDYKLGTNGLIVFDEEKITQAMFKAQQEQYRALAQGTQGQINYLKQSNTGGLEGTYNNFTKEVNKILQSKNLSNAFTKDDAKNILSQNLNRTVNQIKNNTDKNQKIINNKLSTINSSVKNVDSSVQNIDISSVVSKYQGEYNNLISQIREQEIIAAEQNIRGYGTQTQIQQFDAMTSNQRRNLDEYIAGRKNLNRKELPDYKQQYTERGWHVGDEIFQYDNDLGQILTSPLRGLFNLTGGLISGPIYGQRVQDLTNQ